MQRFFVPLALSGLLALAGPLQGQAVSPREELLRSLPADVALCLVVDDFRANGEQLSKSPWLKALKESPLFQALGDAPEMLQLSAIKDQLAKRLQMDWPQLRDEILGDAVVFAYRPGPPGQPDQEQAVLLLHARDPKLLAQLLHRFNAEQLKAGELKELRKRSYKGMEYLQRVEAGGDQFYYQDGGFLAFTSQEAMLQSVLERRALQGAQPLPLVKQLKTAGCDKAVASVWINPRAFDQLLKGHLAELAQGIEAKSLKTFLTCWQALDGVTLSVIFDKEPRVVAAVHARMDALPPATRKLVAAAAHPSEIWNRLPPDGILRIAGRTDFVALLDTLDELLPGEGSQSITDVLQHTLGLPLNKEMLKALAPFLGPDWGICLGAPQDKEGVAELLLAVRVQSRPGELELGKTLVKTLQLFARSAVNDYNRKHKDQVQFKTLKQKGSDVYYFVHEGKLPRGFRPAFSYRDGYLIVGTSPEALERFVKRPGGATPSGTSPLMRLSFKKLADLLKERREPIAAFLAGKYGISEQAAGKRLAALRWGLDLFDHAEIVQHTEGNRVAWVFSVSTVAGKK